MTTIDAVILGIVEGVTEYLPISSTGHLILAGRLLGHSGEASAAFDIVIQLGAILAVLVHYRKLLWERVRARDTQLLLALLLGFLPAAIAGLFLRKTIKSLLFGAGSVAAALILGGVIMIVVQALKKGGDDGLEAVTPKRAFLIGLGQIAALWPGMSRSMSTIVAAQLTGLSTATAAEFSFLLGLPTLGAATLYEAYKSRHELGGELVPVLIGLLVSFAVAWAVIAAFIRYLQHRGLTPFGVYRILLGGLVLFAFAACETTGWAPQLSPTASSGGANPNAPWVVSTTTQPSITFDRAMDPMAGTLELVVERYDDLLGKVEHVIRSHTRVWSADGLTVTLQPAQPFELGRLIRVTAGADMQSAAGVKLHAAHVFTFFFGDPMMMATGPTNTACNSDLLSPSILVPSNPDISLPAGTTGHAIGVSFSEVVTGVTTSNVTLTGPVNGMLSITGSGASYTLTMSGMQNGDDYTITAGSSIRDACGLPLDMTYLLNVSVAGGATGSTGASGTYTNSTPYPIVETNVSAGGTAPCLTAPSGVTGSVIGVTGSGIATVSNVIVNIKTNHSWPDDLEAWLRYSGPGGPKCAILVRNKFGTGAFTDFTFQDGATAPTSGTVASTGTFAPETPLSAFDGLGADGTWSLFVNDDGTALTGTMSSWTLRVFE